VLSPVTIQQLTDLLASRIADPAPDPAALAADIDDLLSAATNAVAASVLYQTLSDARDDALFALRTRLKGTGDWADAISTQAAQTLEILNQALPTELLAPPLAIPYDPTLYLPNRPRPVVLLDVDGVVNLIETDAPIRPGIELLCQAFVAAGADIYLWTGPGAYHAEREATRAGITKYITKFLGKPDYPMTEEAALVTVGCVPVLQVDDDITERVGSWPFLHLPVDPDNPELRI
jgi:hypothetical protein